jgi:predicted DNA-binding transcriptional regulator YafY
MTALELAGELEVSVRTIYRDADALNAAGVPLYGDAGHAGGYQLLGGYRTRLTGLTTAEAQTLFLSGLPGPAAELGLGTVLAAATLKLRAALPASLRENADRLSERFYLDAPGWYRKADDVPHLPLVASAVWDRQVIQVRYRRWKEPAEVSRRLEPHGLVLKAGVWYVVARCEGTFRTYRADQIVDASSCDRGFDPEPGFGLEAYWRSYLADFHRYLHTGDAVIRLSPDGAQRMRSLLSTAVTTAVRADGITDPDGWIRARVPIESAGQALADFLRLGADLEIVEPAELREQTIRTVHAMTALYQTGAEEPLSGTSCGLSPGSGDRSCWPCERGGLRGRCRCLAAGEACGHYLDHRPVQVGLMVVREPLIVTDAAAVFHDPAEGPFHHPAAGQDLEGVQLIGALDDLHGAAQRAGGPGDQLPGVAAVGPDQGDSAARGGQLPQQRAGAVAVLH